MRIWRQRRGKNFSDQKTTHFRSHHAVLSVSLAKWKTAQAVIVPTLLPIFGTLLQVTSIGVCMRIYAAGRPCLNGEKQSMIYWRRLLGDDTNTQRTVRQHSNNKTNNSRTSRALHEGGLNKCSSLHFGCCSTVRY